MINISQFTILTIITVKVPVLVCRAGTEKIWAYLTSIPINTKLPAFDGGGICTAEKCTEDGKLSASNDRLHPIRLDLS